jgi:cation diffusion facilitator CzcD-associated flavoprotein CzcO
MDTLMASAPAGLAALEARLQQDLQWLELPGKAWVPARTVDGREVRDVVVIGAGMCGLAACAALIQLGIRNIVALDRAAPGREGPWVTFARMRTLRSPKQLTGPALGLPSLTFRAHYEARFGRDAWDALGKIPRPLWMEYLIWYRRVLALPVTNEADVTSIQPFADDLLALKVRQGGVTEQVLARHLVLASGRDGLGGPVTPPVAGGIDRRFWAHSAEAIDFAALRGRRVGVVGAGASAMDNAATALEAGAARLDLFIRRADIPRVNKFTGIGSPGVVHGFEALPDSWKWQFLHYVMGQQTPPPRDSTLRVSSHPNAYFHLASPILSLEQDGDELMVATPGRHYRVDFLIFATGFGFDPSRRPELGAFVPHIRLWRDRFQPPAGMASEELSMSPDLAPDFAFQEVRPGACPALRRIHCFNNHATLSHGKLSGDIPGVSEGAERLARGIARKLFVEDVEQHYAALRAFDVAELRGDEWKDADAASQKSMAGEMR